MTFLAPAAGLLAAGIALPLFLGLYLLKLRRRALRVSSTLLWEQAIQDLQANVPLRWLKWSWLLLVQLIALACVLLAVARPAIPGVVGNAERIIILVDRSASMSSIDGVGGTPGKPISRLDQARKEALGVLEQASHASAGATGRAPEVMVVGYAAEPRTLTRFTSSRTELREAIEAIDATDQPDDLSAALDTVRALDAGRDGEVVAAPKTSVVVITDHALRDGEIGGRLPAGTSLRSILVGPASAPLGPGAQQPAIDNLGIVALSAARDANRPSMARVFVRVVNAGIEPQETVVSCRVDDRPSGSVAVRVPGSAVSSDGEYMAGATSATFEVDTPQGGLVTVAISRPDVLASDNQGAVVLGPAVRPRILVVGPGDDAPDPFRSARGQSGIDRFLLGVLQEMDLASLRIIDAAAYKAGVAASDIPSRAWDGFELIIFDRVTPDAAPARPTLSIGAGLPSLGLRVEAVPSGDRLASPTRFALWSRTSPLFRYASPDTVLVSPPMKVTLPDPGATAAKSHAFSELAQGSAGPLIVAVDADRVAGSTPRRLVLAFDLLRTNWGPDVSFPVFVASAVEYLTGRGDSDAGRSYTTTQAVSVQPAPRTETLHVHGPREFDVPVPASVGAAGASDAVSLGVLDRAGVYTVDGVGAADGTIAVNVLSERESAQSPGIPAGTNAAGRPESTGKLGADERSSCEIWHWFIAAAGTLSCIEWIGYALRSRA